MAAHAPSLNPEFDPVLAHAEMNLIRRKEPVRGRLVKSELCMNGKSASFVRHIEVDLSGTALEGKFKVGQAFGVIPPGENDRGRPHNVRLYSLACASWGEDGNGAVVSTTVKRVIDEHKPYKKGDDPDDHSLFLGVCSNYLCDVPLGTELLITGPSGKTFLLPEDPSQHDYFFVAAGTGIAPFRGFVKELFEGPNGPTKSRVVLIMGSPYRTDLLYHRWFCEMASRHPNFEYDVAISREPAPGGSGERGEYVQQLMNRRMDDWKGLLDSNRCLFYVCGLEGMQIGLYRTLAWHGLAHHYLRLPEEFDGVDPNEWPAERIKRRVRPTARAMVEVY